MALETGTYISDLQVLLAPFAVRSWPEIRRDWRRSWRPALVVAVLSPLAYIMVLTALVFTPVSYVAPAVDPQTRSAKVRS